MLNRLKTIRISVAVTQSCKTGERSKSYEDGRPSSVGKAMRVDTGETLCESVQIASLNA